MDLETRRIIILKHPIIIEVEELIKGLHTAAKQMKKANLREKRIRIEKRTHFKLEKQPIQHCGTTTTFHKAFLAEPHSIPLHLESK
ncbi:hypothetical protein AVEN_27993-1 [Araneus ventricosus]|uniref:Uncharacterized protein n=1 Tax=Araneus ventricosus TaxID=182803 RepID=A0A4Y2BHZ3_ARAVE|nr:hypothetical protein AVEN_27993-1 [Araneus ventricosus]